MNDKRERFAVLAIECDILEVPILILNICNGIPSDGSIDSGNSDVEYEANNVEFDETEVYDASDNESESGIIPLNTLQELLRDNEQTQKTKHHSPMRMYHENGHRHPETPLPTHLHSQNSVKFYNLSKIYKALLQLKHSVIFE